MHISVVIPARDDASMLAACLSSLASQTRAPDEILVVDNASGDDTAEVALAAGARVIVEPLVGIPRASATGYDAVTAEVIARLDADSVCPPDWIARIERAFTADPALDFLTGDAWFYGGSAPVRWIGEHWYIGGMYAVLTPFLGHPPLFGSNFAMRREAWGELSAGVHREELGIHDDFDLSLHIEPWMRVRRDRRLVVGVSSRPFASWQSLRRRLSWVIPTIRLHWPQESLRSRRATRRRWRRRLAVDGTPGRVREAGDPGG